MPSTRWKNEEVITLGAFLRTRCGSLNAAFEVLDVQKAGQLDFETFEKGLLRLGYKDDISSVWSAMELNQSDLLSSHAFVAAFGEDKGVLRGSLPAVKDLLLQSGQENPELTTTLRSCASSRSGETIDATQAELNSPTERDKDEVATLMMKVEGIESQISRYLQLEGEAVRNEWRVALDEERARQFNQYMDLVERVDSLSQAMNRQADGLGHPIGSTLEEFRESISRVECRVDGALACIGDRRAEIEMLEAKLNQDMTGVFSKIDSLEQLSLRALPTCTTTSVDNYLCDVSTLDKKLQEFRTQIDDHVLATCEHVVNKSEESVLYLVKGMMMAIKNGEPFIDPDPGFSRAYSVSEVAGTSRPSAFDTFLQRNPVPRVAGSVSLKPLPSAPAAWGTALKTPSSPRQANREAPTREMSFRVSPRQRSASPAKYSEDTVGTLTRQAPQRGFSMTVPIGAQSGNYQAVVYAGANRQRSPAPLEAVTSATQHPMRIASGASVAHATPVAVPATVAQQRFAPKASPRAASAASIIRRSSVNSVGPTLSFG